MTEIAALTRALNLLIHSDLPISSPAPGESPLAPEAMKALTRKERHVLPFMALMQSAEDVIAAEKAWLQPPEVKDVEALDFSYEAAEGVRKARLTFVDGGSACKRVSALLGREINAPCFIVEGSRREAPRAFGVLWQFLRPDSCPDYSVENIGDISIFFATNPQILAAKELQLPKAQRRAEVAPALPPPPPPPPPPSPSALVTISAETKGQANAALEKARRYGSDVEASEKATPVINLLQQVIKGRCPSHRELRITRSMEHDLKKSVVRGGVRSLFEEALPILRGLADEVEELRGSGQT